MPLAHKVKHNANQWQELHQPPAPAEITPSNISPSIQLSQLNLAYVQKTDYTAGLTFLHTLGYSQTTSDTVKPAELKEVIIKSWQRMDIGRLPDEQNGFLNSGKKK